MVYWLGSPPSRALQGRSSVSNYKKGEKTMSAKQNKELVRQAWKAWNEVGGDAAKVPAVYDKYYTSDFIFHNLAGVDMTRAKQMQSDIELVSAFPDSSYQIDDILAEGDRVAIRVTMNGIHRGTFMGIPPTGKHVVGKGEEIYRVTGGKIAESWCIIDAHGLLNQLGAIPSAGAKR